MTGLEIISSTATWVFQTTIKASVLAAIILILQMLLAKKLPAKWIYSLWFLLIVRLVIPFEMASSVSIYNLVTPVEQEPFVSEPVMLSSEKPVISEFESKTPETAITGSDLPQIIHQSGGLSLIQTFSIIWFLGIIALSAYFIFTNIKIRQDIKGRQPINDKELINLFDRCKTRMKVFSPIVLIEMENISLPLLFGFIKPCILIPKSVIKTLSRTELEHIFFHELAHHKRHDITVAWITAVLQTIHWFNPLIWYAFFRMKIDREIACDELTLSYTGSNKSQEYGGTIIHLLQHISSEYRLPMTVGILDQKTGIKKRLAKIANYKPVSLWWTLPALSLILTIGIISLTGAQNKLKETDQLGSVNAGREKQEIQNFKKVPAAEIIISFGAENGLKLNGISLPIDSLSESLNKYRFENNSIIALAPEPDCDLITWMEVQKQLRNIDIKKIKYINNKTGKFVITSKYEPRFINQDSNSLSPVFLNGKYGYKRGYIGGKGEIVIEPKFQEAKFFNEGLAAIKLDGKWGFINPTGEIVIEQKFDKVNAFRGGLAAIQLDEKWGFIDKTGVIKIKPKYDAVNDFSEDLAPVKINNKYGFINKDGNIIITAKFEKAKNFRYGRGAVKLNNRWGFIDKNGKIIVELKYSGVGYFFDDLAKIRLNNRYGFIDLNGKVVIALQYSEADDFIEGLAAVRTEDKKYGYIDKSGTTIVEPQFDFAWNFNNGTAMVTIFENPELNIKGQGLTIDKAGNVFKLRK